MRSSELRRHTPLARKTRLKRSGRLKRRSKRRSKATRAGTRETASQQPCLVCNRFPCDPHHRVPQSRPQDLPAGLNMEAPANLTPLCRECHAEYGALLGEPTRSWLRREAMLANARTWLARHPGALGALPGWLCEALEEKNDDPERDGREGAI